QRKSYAPPALADLHRPTESSAPPEQRTRPDSKRRRSSLLPARRWSQEKFGDAPHRPATKASSARCGMPPPVAFAPRQKRRSESDPRVFRRVQLRPREREVSGSSPPDRRSEGYCREDPGLIWLPLPARVQ